MCQQQLCKLVLGTANHTPYLGGVWMSLLVPFSLHKAMWMSYMLLSNWVTQRKKDECKNGASWVREMICSIGNAWLGVTCVAQGSTFLKMMNCKGGKHLEIPWENKTLIAWLRIGMRWSEDATTTRREGFGFIIYKCDEFNSCWGPSWGNYEP